ncbi:MAG: hypothetical protein ACFFCT_12325 [Candidatus Odinarchaeota archaeon]
MALFNKGHKTFANLTVREEIKPVYPKAETKKESEIKKIAVEAVVKLLKNGGHSFEKTPKVHSELKEEQLRDLLLSYLNIAFEGATTGEPFVRKGKTDIHLRIEEGNILCAECTFLGRDKLSYGLWSNNRRTRHCPKNPAG